MKNQALLRNLLLIIMIFILCFSCNRNDEESCFLRIHEGEYYEHGVKAGYIDTKGDTIIPLGKYLYCFTDTFKRFAIVFNNQRKCFAIDQKENFLYEVFWYDNGPDIIQEGFFRIIKDGKIGYANTEGQIVIQPHFDCAFPFNEGKAKVSYDCETLPSGEYKRWESEEWFYIDSEGNRM